MYRGTQSAAIPKPLHPYMAGIIILRSVTVSAILPFLFL